MTRKRTTKKKARIDSITGSGRPVKPTVGQFYRIKSKGRRWRFYRVDSVSTKVERTPSVKLRRYSRSRDTGDLKKTSEVFEHQLRFDNSTSDHWEMGPDWIWIPDPKASKMLQQLNKLMVEALTGAKQR